ncbi:MAG: choice-of-anchor B family protein [Saprospiraceae bacterium]
MRGIALILMIQAVACLSVKSQNLNITHRSTVTFNNQNLANIWGYAANGYEYALVGGASGLIIVNVTNPDAPVVLKQIPGPTSPWREIRTYQNYAYVVTEGGAVGVQIVNLSNLPDTNLVWKNVSIGGLTRAHALDVDEARGFLYLYGSNVNGGRAIVWNLSNPYNPTYAGTYTPIGYVHDGYTNNDTMYSAHIYQGTVAIVYMGNKNSPATLGTFNTPNNFPHNTWRSGNVLLTTDEVSNSFLSAYDISDPSDPVLLDKIQSNPGSGVIVHNTHAINQYAVTSWYKDGVVIVDFSRPDNLVQVGNYDTYPNQGGNGFEGCWGVYPYLPSGNLLISNIRAHGTNNGEMMVLTPTYVRGCYLEGTVTHSQTGDPIPGAQITIVGGPSEFSMQNGQYKMGQAQAGTFTVNAFKAGFQPYSATVSLSNGTLTIHDIQLTPIGINLPVAWLFFEAEKSGDQAALLRWATAQEQDNAGFAIEHSRDGVRWTEVGFTPPSPTRQYRFEHTALAAGRHYYRLRQRDTDGAETLSPIRVVEIAGRQLIAALAGNIAEEQALLMIADPQAPSRLYLVETYDKGLQLMDSRYQSGDGTLRIPCAHWPAGIYLVSVRAADMEPALLKFLKR